VSELLRRLLGGPAALDPAALGSVEAFLAAQGRRAASLGTPMARAIAGGFAADRLGLAFAAGYQAALAALVPAAPAERLALCATEEGGAHPRAIRTTLRLREAGRMRLDGQKRWATMAPLAEVLLVVASLGETAEGRNVLRLARVPAAAPGVRITPMPPPPFAPEIPHAEISLEGVAVREEDLLDGDGYEAYLKPFRTLEDAHVHGALLGYLLGVGRRHGFPEGALERLAAVVVTAEAIAAAPPMDAGTHLALAGLLGATHALMAELDPLWAGVGPEERARWARDRALLDVAARAREARRARAWERLREAGSAG